MKIDNFKLVEVLGSNALNWRFKATVDVTTGIWFKKKTEKKEIFKTYISSWWFSDSGKFLPMDEMSEFERSFMAKEGKELHLCCVDQLTKEVIQ